MKLNGSEILIKTLLEQDVDVLFGYPGGAILNVHDMLYKYQNELRHIVTSHEQGACHAADAYARVTGKAGVLLVTSGPGATNIVTGLANAYMDSIPLVAITGNVPKTLIGRDSFQEIDIAGITMPITKSNYIVDSVEHLADVIREAFEIAISGRPGPVLIDIPKNVTADLCEYVPKEKVKKRPVPEIPQSDIEKSVELIKNSKKPLLYVGGGVTFSDASSALVAFAEKLDIPVVTSMMGLSSIPYNHELNLGMIGMHGTPVANLASMECDLMLTMGARFNDRVAGSRENFAKQATILHVDIDESEHSKNVVTDVCIHGSCADFFEKVANASEQKKNKEWTTQLAEYKKQKPMPSGANIADKDTTMELRYILDEIEKNVPKDTIIVTDVGQHQMITAQSYKFKEPRTFVSSCGLGTMGFGTGAAIGAKIGQPDKEVVLITGDGSFHMNLNEIAAMVSEGLNIKIVLINNGVLGMVRQWQKMFYDKRYSNVDIRRKTDFVKLAEAFSIKGHRISDISEVADKVKEVFEANDSALIEFVINEEEGVFPIIPPGGSAKDIILE